MEVHLSNISHSYIKVAESKKVYISMAQHLSNISHSYIKSCGMKKVNISMVRHFIKYFTYVEVAE